jgi:predicted phosphoribosyltransferase
MTYADRRAAGAALAEQLAAYGGAAREPGSRERVDVAGSGTAQLDGDVLVLGLVRGGVPVAAEVARRLALPLDALVVRKLGVPWAPEVAFGALGPGGVRVLNEEISTRLTPEEVGAVVRHESAELARRERRFRGNRSQLELTGRTALIIDDGLATGATARAAVAVARQLRAAWVVFAVPVAAAEAVDRLRQLADEVICPLAPADFGAVSRFYDDFGQVSDAEVASLLRSSPI